MISKLILTRALLGLAVFAFLFQTVSVSAHQHQPSRSMSMEMPASTTSGITAMAPHHDHHSVMMQDMNHDSTHIAMLDSADHQHDHSVKTKQDDCCADQCDCDVAHCVSLYAIASQNLLILYRNASGLSFNQIKPTHSLPSSLFRPPKYQLS